MIYTLGERHVEFRADCYVAPSASVIVQKSALYRTSLRERRNKAAVAADFRTRFQT